MTTSLQNAWRMEPDAWLAGLWNRPVFRLVPGAEPDGARAVIAGAWPSGPAFVYAKVPADRSPCVAGLESLGFHAVDVNITLDREPGAVPPHTLADLEIDDARASDEAAVLDVAGSCFRYSRFHLDPRVPAELANRIKREWMANYFRRVRGEALLVARLRGAAVGFLAILSSAVAGGRASVIDLVGVSASAQGRGIGRALVEAFIGRGMGRCDTLRVGTQVANIPSLRLYEQCGFKVAESTYVLHGHFDRPLAP